MHFHVFVVVWVVVFRFREELVNNDVLDGLSGNPFTRPARLMWNATPLSVCLHECITTASGRFAMKSNEIQQFL